MGSAQIGRLPVFVGASLTLCLLPAIQKIEQEKTNRDHTIRSLNDEIANQDEVINKLNKEKKHISENAAKSAEDLGAAEVSSGASTIKAKPGWAKGAADERAQEAGI